MVLGTTSGAGKSWLATALCRWYARQGLRVAPFKAQNMSNNARVVGDAEGLHGGEIGSAQYFQALAARATPDVRMNPLLLKPERDTHSQVVLMGQVSAELTAMPWRGRSERVWPAIVQALDSLRASHDVVVIEGAGSPAEINLHASDIVNMRVARHAGAQCVLVTDIDRGGAFAHLYGTWALLPADEQALIKGFVLNKFRGDAALLAPAPQMLQERTEVPTIATLPMWWQHGLPEEDGVFDARIHIGTEAGAGPIHTRIAIVAYPRISNLDWLRAQGLDAAIAAHVQAGGRVLGICGGLQMLGEALIDPHGIDGNAPGLGLLPVVTLFEPAKTVCHRQAVFASLAGPWALLSGVALRGYEIHHGQTARHPAMAAGGDVAREVLQGGLGWQSANGQVLGLYLHGMFEDPAVLQALFGAQAPTLDTVFDGLADFVDAHIGHDALMALLQVKRKNGA